MSIRVGLPGTALFIFFLAFERRNVGFKMDIRHSFFGYKISRPYFGALPFTHILELDALDVGLQLWHALRGTKQKKRRIGWQKG